MKSSNSKTPPTPTRSSPVPLIILIIAVIAVALPFLLVESGEDIIDWRTDVDEALAEAKRVNRPLLLYFTADWCPPCKMMKRVTFSQQNVKEHVEANYVPVRLDMTKRNETTQKLGARFGIQYLPTMLVLSPEGEELRRESGGMDAETFMAWMKRQ